MLKPKTSPAVEIRPSRVEGSIKSVRWMSTITPLLGPAPFTEQDFEAALRRAARPAKSAAKS